MEPGFESILEKLPEYERKLRDLKETILANLVMISEIPSPTFSEQRRVQFLTDRFDEYGLQNCSTDEVDNAIGILPGTEGERNILVVAHLDTNFDNTVDHTISVETDRVIGRRTYPIDYDSICRVITRYNPIAQPVAMIRRSVLRQVGDYDERYPRCQDYDLWCRIAEHHPIANVDDFLLQYRISASQGKTTHLKESLRLTLTIQRHYLFHPRFMNPLNVAAWLAQATLLRLPDALVMRAFKALRYRKV